MKLKKFFPLVIALAATGAYAQDDSGAGSDFGQNNFDSYDNDNDGSLSREEFDQAVETVTIYETYDIDGDGLLSEDEYSGIEIDDDLEIWDSDSDGYLDTDEFHEGTFTTFDDNEDGHWDGNEWDDAGDAGLFDI